MDKKYVMTGLGYAILGMVLGIYMAASHNHGQLVTHAHILLLGFLTSFVYAVCHKLWLNEAKGALMKVQFLTHQLGTALMVLGLFLMYGQFASEAVLGPVLGVASISVLIGMVLMKVLFIKTGKEKAAGVAAAA